MLLVANTASLCFGQAFTADLTGVVTDPASAVIPGVEGRYTFSQLLPGTYELTASSTGFKTFVQTNLILRANQSAAVGVTLQVGGLTGRVEVTAAAVQLDTQTADQALTLNRDMVLSLPANAHNPMSLIHATAGVTAPGVGITQATQDVSSLHTPPLLPRLSPASPLLRSVPPLGAAFVLSPSWFMPLVASSFASAPKVPMFRIIASPEIMPPLCRIPSRP